MSEALDPDDYATAEEILRDALARVKREREGQANYVIEVRGQLEYGEEMLRQAEVAEAALEALINSQDFQFSNAALGQIAEIEAAEAEPEPAAQAVPEPIDWQRLEYPVTDTVEAFEAVGGVAGQQPAIAAPAEPEAVAQPEPTTEPICQPAAAAEPPAVRKSPSFEERRGGKAAAFQREDEDRLLTAIAKLCGATGEVQISLTGLAEASGIPTGSMTFVVRRAVDAGQLEVTKNFRPGSRTPAPSTYRLVGAQPCKTAPKYSDPIPEAAPKAPERPKESLLWEKAEPVAKTRPARAIPATDCPAIPAAAPPRPDQALVIPVDQDDADLPAWWPPGSLLALKYGDCRWPTNTPPLGRGEEMKFCCAPVVDGESYCPAHAAKAHGRQVRA